MPVGSVMLRTQNSPGISKNAAGITQLELLKFGGSAGKFERVNEANIRRVLGDGEVNRVQIKWR